MKTEKIVSILQELGFILELFSTVQDAKIKYSARFVLKDSLTCKTCGNFLTYKCYNYHHANTIKEAIKLASDDILKE